MSIYAQHCRYTNVLYEYMYTQPYHCNVRIVRNRHLCMYHEELCNAEVLLRRELVCLECALSLQELLTLQFNTSLY
jgi:hypothetical protein